jgi:hypothetical protein
MWINLGTWPKVLRWNKSFTVETFYLQLEGLQTFLGQPGSVEQLEIAILKHLPQGECLLRWAIVRVKGSTFWCEGAYVKG